MLPISIEVDGATLENCTKHLTPSNRKENTLSNKILEYRKHRIKIEKAKIIVKLVEAKDALEKCIQRQDFVVAQTLKTQIDALEEDKDKLQCILNNADPKELNKALEDR